MKLALQVLLTTLIFPLSSSYAGGNGVSNGGGFAQCPDQQFYSYDYLLTLKYRQSGQEVPVRDLQTSLRRISSQLNRLHDPLAKEFDQFIAMMYTQTPGAPYQWFQRANLRLLYGPDLRQALPSECHLRQQAVYFTAPFRGVPYSAYVYDPDLIRLVLSQQNGALQVSYLWVHEWLWNYFDQVDFVKLATFNRLLHSKKLTNMSPEEFAHWRLQILKPESH